jgi:hypothetical protein
MTAYSTALPTRSLVIAKTTLTGGVTPYPVVLTSRNLVIAKTALTGGVTQRSYALPSRGLILAKTTLGGRYTTRVYSHQSRGLVIARTTLNSKVFGGVVFSQLLPAEVQFSPPKHMVSEHIMQSGEVEMHLWADSNSGATLDLSYINISDAQAELILKAYDLAYEASKNVILPLAMLTGINTDLATYMLRGGKNAIWYFTSVPSWTPSIKGYGKLRVSFISRCLTIGSAIGGNVPFPAVAPSTESPTSHTGNDFIIRVPDTGVGIPRSWVRQRQNTGAPTLLRMVSDTDDNGNVYVATACTDGIIRWLTVTKFSTAGNQLWSKDINRTTGVENEADLYGNNAYRGIAVGSQGVVVCAGGRTGFTTGVTHKLICLSKTDGGLMWAKSFRVSDSGGSHFMTGLWANTTTGHTYVFENFGGGGNSNGGLSLTVFDVAGTMLTRLHLGFYSGGSLATFQTILGTPLVLPDGAFMFTGGHTSTYSPGQQWTFTHLLAPDGVSFLRSLRYFNATGFGHNLTRLLDGRIALGQSIGTFIFNADGTAILSRPGDAIVNDMEVMVGANGNYYLLSADFQNTAQVTEVNSSMTQVMSSRSILLGAAPGEVFTRSTGDLKFGPNLGRCIVTPGNWGNWGKGYGVMSFELFDSTYQYSTAPSYNYFAGSPNTIAKHTILTTTPTAVTGSTTIPTLIDHDVTPASDYVAPAPIGGLMGEYPVLVTDETSTVWDFYSSN